MNEMGSHRMAAMQDRQEDYLKLACSFRLHVGRSASHSRHSEADII